MWYYASPIDLAVNPTELARLISKTLILVQKFSLPLFRPSRAYDNASASESVIPLINNYALQQCQGVIAVIDGGTPTLGVPVEVETALRSNKPVFLFTQPDTRNKSVQIREWESRGVTVCVDLDTGDKILGEFISNCDTRNNQNLLIRLAPELPIPQKAYSDDAGFDLSYYPSDKNSDLWLLPNEFANIPTGVAIAIPDGYWGLIIGRSSTWFYRRLLVNQAVIDQGWRGELFIAIQNISNQPVRLRPGDRLAQIILMPTWQGELQTVDELPSHPRGLKGFGSTGLSGTIGQ